MDSKFEVFAFETDQECNESVSLSIWSFQCISYTVLMEPKILTVTSMFKLFQNPSHTSWIPLTTFTNTIFTAAAKNRHNKACTRNGWQEYSCSCCSIGSTGCKDIHLPLYSKLQPWGKCEFLSGWDFFY